MFDDDHADISNWEKRKAMSEDLMTKDKDDKKVREAAYKEYIEEGGKKFNCSLDVYMMLRSNKPPEAAIQITAL